MAEQGGYSIYEDPSADLVYLAANLKREGPSQDTNVQKAIRSALDYTSIRELIGGGAETPASFIPQGYPEAITEGVGYDVKTAKKCLEAAGYAQGVKMSLAYHDLPYLQVLAEEIFCKPSGGWHQHRTRIAANIYEFVAGKRGVRFASTAEKL